MWVGTAISEVFRNAENAQSCFAFNLDLGEDERSWSEDLRYPVAVWTYKKSSMASKNDNTNLKLNVVLNWEPMGGHIGHIGVMRVFLVHLFKFAEH